jgi:hypothetical protein
MSTIRARYSLFALVAVALVAVAPALAERGDDSKRASKNGLTEGTIDGVEILVEYGRPKVKDREIWGGLVPYDKIWRAGADEATNVTFDRKVEIEGQPLAAGTYAFYAVPNASEWTLVFNSAADNWGAYGYDEAKDVLRVTVVPGAGEHVEELDYVIEGDAVALRWEKLMVPFRVEAAE